MEYSSSSDDKKNEKEDSSAIQKTDRSDRKIEAPPLVGSKEFINRDLGWLQFNRRVLSEALDVRTPLLERLRFLGIANSNLDEFFMKRVGILKRQMAAGILTKNQDGISPKDLLVLIRQEVTQMLKLQSDGYLKQIRPAMKTNGIVLLKWSELSEQEATAANKFFKENIFPVLTPLAVDSGHPFPFLSNLSTSLGVTVSPLDKDEKLFARIKIPKSLPQWLNVSSLSGGSLYRFVSLEEILIQNLGSLFTNMKVTGVMPFRITRNIEIQRDEEDADDLLEMIEEELRQRKFAHIVRLEHGPNPDPWILSFLIQELELTDDDLYELPAELDYSDLKPIFELPIPQLKYESWNPVVPPALMDQEASIFATVKKNDILLHHPYDSFSASVERFIRTAAEDPKVMAIKMTLYRTDENSSFVRSLIRAAESGKQVVCLVEVKARFEEARNINWATTLENAGVHVVYGIVGLKTHAKTALVVRQEIEGLRSYVHIGTGNYHAGTARQYSDFGFLTSNSEITADVIELFHYLTGRSLKSNYQKLIVAPVNMLDRFLFLIEREIQNKKDGKPAHIIAKVNNLEEPSICRALYRASQAGVEIDLIVRGFCCLRPGVQGLSETIKVISVIGRFLEHARVFYFRNGQKDPLAGDFLMGSADWMYRNLMGRVEAVTPIEDPVSKDKCWEVLQATLLDQRQVWDMKSDGSYVQRQPSTELQQVGLHQVFMKAARSKLPPGQILGEDEVMREALEASRENRHRTSRKSRRKK